MSKVIPFKLTGLEGFLMFIRYNTMGQQPLLDSGLA